MSEGSSNQHPKRKVTFTLKAPWAEEVVLVGDFNDWNANGDPMRKDESGTWKASVTIPPGEYQYKLVVDGKWRLDSRNPRTVTNRFGTKNNVLIITESDRVKPFETR
jgi:1,4-alpha-glucan branching enzyme